jgi:hypothetical protein
MSKQCCFLKRKTKKHKNKVHVSCPRFVFCAEWCQYNAPLHRQRYCNTSWGDYIYLSIHHLQGLYDIWYGKSVLKFISNILI